MKVILLLQRFGEVVENGVSRLSGPFIILTPRFTETYTMLSWNNLTGYIRQSPCFSCWKAIPALRDSICLSLITLISVAAAPASAGFITAPSYPAGGGAMAVADFNRDGIADIAATSPSGVTILLGIGDGTFQVTQTYAAGPEPEYSVAVGDFNGDGIPDLVVTNVAFDEGDPNTVTVLLGNGDGTFQPAQNYAAGSNPFTVAVGDFNGDGVPDLAVANNNPAVPGNVSRTVSILLGNGDGTFQAPQSYAVAGPYAQCVVVGDFNEDGHLDLAVAHFQEPYGGSDVVTILLGNGDGTFHATGTLSFAGGEADPYALAVADLNGDGHLDLIFCSNQPVMIFLGHGDGTFSAPIDTGVQAGVVAVGDFNGDGFPDLGIVSGLIILLNDGHWGP